MNNILKLFIIGILLSSLVMCKPKEIIVTQTIHDSITTERIDTVIKAVHHNIVIEEPCDSTGILKEFKQTLKTEGAEVVVSNEGGAIDVSIDIEELKKTWEKEFISKQEVIIKEVPVDKPVPFIPKLVWYFLGVVIFYIVYRILRIYVPFLKFLPY